MFIVIAYIKFLLRSTNQHGVHSPFVFDLVTQCFYDKKDYPAYPILKNYRNSLLKDKRKIRVKDFGAGSRIFKSNERKVSKMAKTAGISVKRARLLYRLVRYLEVEEALELGTSLGMGTAAMAAENRVRITTIEGCPETAAVARKQFKDFRFDNIELVVGEFGSFLEEKGKRIENNRIQNSELEPPNFPETNKLGPETENRKQKTGNNRQPTTEKYDLIFLDGNHQKGPTLSYFEKLLPFVHNGTVMVFDDIHWSKGMEEAWEEIKLHPSVRVSIDTFYQGFIFFRREQAKEHFVVRV